MGPDATYLSQMLDRQLAFLIEQEDHAVITSIPGFLQALRHEPQPAIHLGDLHDEAEALGRALHAEEYDGGNPGQLLELGFDEIGSKLLRGAPVDAYLEKATAFKGLLGAFNHPFVLPFPGTSQEAVGRVATLLVWLTQLAELVPSGVLQLQTSGHIAMAERNDRIQESARFHTRTDPGIALLSLEAVENLLLESKAIAEPGETKARWSFKYDSSHEMTTKTDGRGGSLTTEYDSSHRVIKQIDPLKRERKWEYVGDVGDEYTVTRITEPNGAITREEFNPNGLPVSITHDSGTSLASTTSYQYGRHEQLHKMIDPDGYATIYGYNSAGDRTSEVNPDGDETLWEYNKAHEVISYTTPTGEKTTIKREAHGNPEVIERPAPGGKTQITKYKYDSHGDLESMTDPLERTWKYEYDTYGDRTSETDPESDRRTWEYNEDSQETATVSPRGNVSGGEPSKFTTKIERDAQGRPLTVTDPLGHTTKYTYDGNGNLEKLTDGNGHKTTYTYDADNELVKIETPNGIVSETEYDSMGRVTGQTDGRKHTTKYTRNLLEEVTEATNPLDQKATKEYDAAGNLTKLTDPAKRTTTYTYDPANRLSEISYSSGNPSSIKYEYNPDGERVKMTDGTGTSTYKYDQLGRLIESKDGNKEAIKYEYDLANELTKITYPNGKAVTRTFDKARRLQKVTDWLENSTQFAYNADSELARTTFPSATGDVDKYEYNQDDSMSSQTMTRGSETLASYGYGHDNDNQVNTITNHNGESGEEKTGFEYDTDNRLTKIAGAVAYEYDAANDPTKIGTSTYAYNSADELEKGGGDTYAYNEMDERIKTTPTSGPATTYGYDQAGNLISTERPKEGETAKIEDSYAYNGSGLRTSQTISGTTHYLAWEENEELPLLLSDSTNIYIYGPGDLPVEQINNSTEKALYLHHDQAGSPRLITGSTGTVEGKCSYSSYGTPTCEGSASTPLGYDAQYTSSDTGLIYLRNRVYDPATAQFLSVDPLEMVSRAPYTYASDSPLNHRDSTGLGEWEPWTESFWTEGNVVSESPLNPIPYYEEEVESYENGCGYFASVPHGLEGTLAGAALFAGGEGADEADITVSDVLEGKLGKITKAPLPPGSPAWADIQDMSIADVRAAAKANEPGFRTILKLLTEGKYNKP